VVFVTALARSALTRRPTATQPETVVEVH
jgi:hypothetical protein